MHAGSFKRCYKDTSWRIPTRIRYIPTAYLKNFGTASTKIPKNKARSPAIVKVKVAMIINC